MISISETGDIQLIGPAGSLVVPAEDEITLKLAMLYEGECEGLGSSSAADKFGYSGARYRQLRQLFQLEGALALMSKPTGPRRCYRRTDDLVRRVIRHRLLHPNDSAKAIVQALHEEGYEISLRSVERVLHDYGLKHRGLTPKL